MKICFAPLSNEKEFGYYEFNRSLRQSGIYVDSNSMTGGGLDSVQHFIYGDEEAIEYYFDLWLSGYRGGDGLREDVIRPDLA